ncbi:MAG: hypothetical protein AAFR61_02910 [Bacteroidota bacterium]
MSRWRLIWIFCFLGLAQQVQAQTCRFNMGLKDGVSITYSLGIADNKLSCAQASNGKFVIQAVEEDKSVSVTLNARCASCEYMVGSAIFSEDRSFRRRFQVLSQPLSIGKPIRISLQFSNPEGNQTTSPGTHHITLELLAPPKEEPTPEADIQTIPKPPKPKPKPKTKPTPVQEKPTDPEPTPEPDEVVDTTDQAAGEKQIALQDSITQESTETDSTRDASPFWTLPEDWSAVSTPQWIVLVGGGLSILLLLIWLGRRKKGTPEESPALATVPATKEAKMPPTPKAEKQQAAIAATGTALKFKPKEKTSTAPESTFAEISTLVAHPSYRELNLGDLWTSSQIEKVFIHRDCLSALDTFIHEENVTPFNELAGAEIPEIGGFLLGRHQVNANQTYWVSLDRFVPIQSNHQGVYQIEFGTKAWLELDEVKDRYPNLQTIGWFHTHPGHGLFLSKPDLKIQEGFFRKPYQLALEIDTLTEARGLDTAIFTWKEEGSINNSLDRHSEKWFSWHEIVKGLPAAKAEDES